jgi:hypothetical protein
MKTLATSVSSVISFCLILIHLQVINIANIVLLCLADLNIGVLIHCTKKLAMCVKKCLQTQRCKEAYP